MKRIQCRVCKEFTDFRADWICSEECREISKKRDEEAARVLREVEERNELDKAERLKAKAERKQKRIRKRAERALGLKAKVTKQAKKIRVLKQRRTNATDFYSSPGWQKLRYEVLRHWGRTCMLCGATGCELHVDHIKPRSTHPNLELSFGNLQVLCRACNLGKSNRCDKDWRPTA